MAQESASTSPAKASRQRLCDPSFCVRGFDAAPLGAASMAARKPTDWPMRATLANHAARMAQYPECDAAVVTRAHGKFAV
eukprot:8707026-Pyramimonas_sp.AAC.1